MQCPWLVCCSPTQTRAERRAGRVREPLPLPDTVVYRSDGASRGQGRSDMPVASWGAAVWAPTSDGRAIGVALATSRGFLGSDITNNVAEYEGLRQLMLRAVRVRDGRVMFEVDSMLLARQTARYRPWACRTPTLVPIHSQCVELGSQLQEYGIACDTRHLYREFNQVADSLANQALDDRDSNGPGPGW